MYTNLDRWDLNKIQHIKKNKNKTKEREKEEKVLRVVTELLNGERRQIS